MREGGVKAMPRSAASGGGNGGLIMFVGILFILFFLICFITQITTNEAWVQGQSALNLLSPNWGVVLQPYQFIRGELSVTSGAFIFAWGIELVYLAFSIVGFELIHTSVHQAGRILGFVFEALALVAVAINWYTDYAFGTLGSGGWGHFGFATMTAFVVGYFSNIGFYLIRHGYHRL